MMHTFRFVLATALLLTDMTLSAQGRWGISGRYLTADGKPVFLSGVNYIVSDGWLINLPAVSDSVFEADMAALQAIGVNHIRFFPLWPLTQPEPRKINPLIINRLDALAERAGRHQITVQLAPITGWMSGAVFLPAWAKGDLLRDPDILTGQEYLAGRLAGRYRNHRAVLGYDFGNELNVLIDKVAAASGKPYTAEAVEEWMSHIYRAFKQTAPEQLVTNGIGTGYNRLFDIRRMSPFVDYFAPHSYAYFHGTAAIDPWYGQRTTYSANYIAAWCEMMGKPVVIQEIGCSEAWMPPARVGDYPRLNCLSTWADGAAGFLWWSSHNIDTSMRVPAGALISNLSGPTFSAGRFSRLEYSLGLLHTNNTRKEYGETFCQTVQTVNRLGLDWTDRLPVCYLVVPSDKSFDEWMPVGITAYVLAKQCHFDVKLCFEGTEIPSDAQAVFIPSLNLTGNAHRVIQQYLQSGGQVYQSYHNNFGPAIHTLADSLSVANRAEVYEPAGQMEAFQRIGLPAAARYRKTSCRWPAMVHAAWQVKQFHDPEPGTVVFASQPVGKGTYYYCSGNLEEALAGVYDPWKDTGVHLFYSALRPRSAIETDNRFVELFVKTGVERQIVLLLNHSPDYQQVTLRSNKALNLVNEETGEAIGRGTTITVLMRPAQVLVAENR